MKKKVEKLYEKFFRLTSKKQDFIFQSSSKEKKMIENFLAKLDETANEEWLFDFLLFGFSRYADLETRYGKGLVQLSWVIGQKAIDTFKKRTEEQLYYTQKFKEEYGINKEVKKEKPFNESFLNREKQRFYNTERGLLHCKEMLFTPNESNSCLNCKFKEECKTEI